MVGVQGSTLIPQPLEPPEESRGWLGGWESEKVPSKQNGSLVADRPLVKEGFQ